ncbi:MAG: IS630 family transposase [Desulfococcaceae bacterium]|jgi:transposase|nr:IS630 family transposase [Desulfococcaceae bacterium]
MESVRIRLRNQTRKALEKILRQSEEKGDLQTARRVMAVLALTAGHLIQEITSILIVSENSVNRWIEKFLINGPKGLLSQKPPGRKPRLTKSQKRELDRLIVAGPSDCGFPGACWRSPMIQKLIYDKFGIFYSIHYISQLLKNMGFSFQKAKFVSDHKNPEKRRKWLETQWPEILKITESKNCYVLFGDEASFPQWGSLSYTWAKKGQTPVVKTSGIRKGYKVFGLIDYFTGRFFCKGHEGRLNSESYKEFLKEVMKKTRKHIILIQDGAPYHTSKMMKDFFLEYSHLITVYQLPSYSPDYNPIEKLWKKIKEKEIHLHYFPTFDSLKNKVEEALFHFKDMQNEILSLFNFYDELNEQN